MLPAGSTGGWYGSQSFQWAPTLVGECYEAMLEELEPGETDFNGYPPLWVNATAHQLMEELVRQGLFQWAPTIVGEC